MANFHFICLSLRKNIENHDMTFFHGNCFSIRFLPEIIKGFCGDDIHHSKFVQTCKNAKMKDVIRGQ